MATKPARMGRAIWLYKRACRRRILRFLLLQRRPWSSLTHETGSFAVETPSQRIKTLCSADSLLPTAAFSLHSSTGFPDSLLPSDNFKELKRASLQRRCCKCRTIFVAHALLPCTPLMITASASHAWGNPTRRMHSKRQNVLTARIWVSPICARGSLSFQRPTPPLASSQEPVRKKQRGRGSQRLETSELTPAPPLRASPFPFREGSPVHFSQPDQRTTACCWRLQTKRWSTIKCLPWTSLWPRIITRLRLLVGRQRSPTFPSRAEKLRPSLDMPTCLLDKWPWRFILWRIRYGQVWPRPRGFQGAAQRDRPSPTHHQRVTVAPECALAIQRLAASFKIGASDPLKTFQNMLCLMASASPVLQLGLLRMRPLQYWLKPLIPSHAWRVKVDRACLAALAPCKDSQWMERGMPLGMVCRRKVVMTDASNIGWGALVRWHADFRPLVETGRSTAYQLPGTAGSIAGPSKLLVTPEGIPRLSPVGQHDGLVLHKSPGRSLLDVPLFPSRVLLGMGSAQLALTESDACAGQAEPRSRHAVSEDWTLHPQMVQEIWEIFGKAEVDRFASKDNFHCPTYFSKDTNALDHNWPNLLLYAFSPTALIPQVIR